MHLIEKGSSPPLLIHRRYFDRAGEIQFVTTGVIFQLSSMVMESCRLILVQILLQRRGLKLNPVTVNSERSWQIIFHPSDATPLSYLIFSFLACFPILNFSPA